MCYYKSQKKFLLSLLDSHATNIVKDIFNFTIEDIKNVTPGRDKSLTLQNPVRILVNPR